MDRLRGSRSSEVSAHHDRVGDLYQEAHGPPFAAKFASNAKGTACAYVVTMLRPSMLAAILPIMGTLAGCSAGGAGEDASQASAAAVTSPSLECKTYGVYGREELGCTATECKTYSVYGSDQLGCTATECKAYGVYGRDQLGCTATACKTYGVYGSDQLGCTATECKTYGVSGSDVLGCPKHPSGGYVVKKKPAP